MSRELRATLAIIIVVLIVGAPMIFAEPTATQGTTSYLALVFQLKPSATPIPPPPTVNTGPPTVMPTMTRPTRTPLLPTATPALPPPTYNDCQADPNPNSAPNYPIKISNINKVAESVTLQNVSTSAIDLTDWQMCSITGNQHHPISGILAAGASQTFVNTGGPIWNNSTADPGALYNPSGQLVSYFNS